MIQLSQRFKYMFLTLMTIFVFSAACQALPGSKADTLSRATFYVH